MPHRLVLQPDQKRDQAKGTCLKIYFLTFSKFFKQTKFKIFIATGCFKQVNRLLFRQDQHKPGAGYLEPSWLHLPYKLFKSTLFRENLFIEISFAEYFSAPAQAEFLGFLVASLAEST